MGFIKRKLNIIFCTSFILLLVFFLQPNSTVASGAQTLGELPIGTVVRDIDGHKEPWYVVSHDHYGVNHTLLLQKSIIANHVYDATLKPWKDSEIRAYLRSTFYNTLSVNFKNNIQVVTTESYGQINSDDTVFLLSATELGNIYYYYTINSPDGREINGIATYRHLDGNYWTRTKESNYTSSTYYYNSYGWHVNATGSQISMGVRPAVNLNPTTPVFGPYGDDGHYTLFQGYKNDLSDLTLSAGTLSPSFSSNQTNYTVTVPNEVNSINFTPTAAYVNTIIQVNGTTVSSGSPVNVPLIVGSNEIRIEVTGEENVKRTYRVTVTREVSSNANLSSLTFSHGTLNPIFSSMNTDYVINVGNEISEIDITATAEDSSATLEMNNISIPSGVSKNISLQVGLNNVDVEVTAPNGNRKIYNIKIYRAQSNNAYLSNLTLNNGSLNTTFNSNTFNYTSNVNYNISSIMLTPTLADSNATITVNGGTVTNNSQTSPINLAVGPNTITIMVTAQSGITTQTYTLTINRAAPIFVTYNGNGQTGGTVPNDSHEYSTGENVIINGNSGNLEKVGFHFVGWNTQANGNGVTYQPGETIPMGNQNLILYAKWEINEYKVSFHSDGGTNVADVKANYDTKITAPSAPTKAGHTFGGWYKEATFDTPWDFVTDKVTENTILYAKWDINEYTVNFDSTGGTNVADVKANYDTKITAPSAPKKVGHTFGGWYKEATFDTPWNFETDKVIENKVLYAKWNVNEYTVNFNSDGGTSVSEVKANYDTKITAPSAPTKAGHTFGGWYKEATFDTPWNFATDKVTENTVLYAKWDINEYTVSFDSTGGTNVAEVKANYDTIITAPLAPTKAGHTFSGWYKEATFDTPWNFETDKVIENQVLYAKWDINEYTISFDSTGGTNIADVKANYDTKITAPLAPTKAGHTFSGWYKEVTFDTPWNFETDKVTENTVLYAKWEINEYTFSFDSTGGTNVADVKVNYDTIITAPPAPTKAGHTFSDWYKEATFDTPWDFATDKVTENTVLYAKWEINEYTFSFDSTGGTNVADVKANYDTIITAPPAPTKAGHTFSGWYKEATFDTPWDFATDKVTENTVLYAKWDINEYTVNFDSTGGTNVADVKANYDTKITAPSAPTKAGHTFSGWYKEATFDTLWDFETDKVIENQVLYAKWNVNKYTVNFNSNGGTNVSEVKVNYGTKITVPPTPTKVGYTFGGWYKDTNLTEQWYFATEMITQNVTLYAKWNVISYGGDDYSPPPQKELEISITDSIISNGENRNIDVQIINNKLRLKSIDTNSGIQLNKVQQHGDVLFINYGLSKNPDNASIDVDTNTGTKKVVILYDDQPYKYFEYKSNELKNKEWDVKLNQELDSESIVDDSFLVTDAKGTKVNIEFSISEDGKIITVIPTSDYKSGEIYILTISNKVKSKDGQQLKEPVRLIFKVQ
ncbi:InlB B-repeat-containing protein [Lysinibacillus sp. BW-2-10]|uniref:InlB B-repeat-containing protein n=1 Tax=Lysinibacillus sp. BW-2-10 TaxID=2590030 RepID=UPI00117C2FB2|nr:InlB B-repeat-containing protein [Lysinibacillus sp. BW-2-10]TSI07371.1 hypothetical protein FJQ64_08705 [Lysinibacillus sp. BW-2-10]